MKYYLSIKKLQFLKIFVHCGTKIRQFLPIFWAPLKCSLLHEGLMMPPQSQQNQINRFDLDIYYTTDFILYFTIIICYFIIQNAL